jgi:heme oxygenase
VESLPFASQWNKTTLMAAIVSGERHPVPAMPDQDKAKEHEEYLSRRALYHAAYTTYLLARHGWLSALDQVVSGPKGQEFCALLGFEPDIKRSKDLLEKDLLTFMLSPEQLRGELNLADFDSTAKIIGLFFAHLLLEKSNPQIASAAESSLGVDNHRGASYFDRHPEDFRENLAGFCAAINRLPKEVDFSSEAVSFAKEAFLRLGSWEKFVESLNIDYTQHSPELSSKSAWKKLLLEPLRELTNRFFSGS